METSLYGIRAPTQKSTAFRVEMLPDPKDPKTDPKDSKSLHAGATEFVPGLTEGEAAAKDELVPGLKLKCEEHQLPEPPHGHSWYKQTCQTHDDRSWWLLVPFMKNEPNYYAKVNAFTKKHDLPAYCNQQCRVADNKAAAVLTGHMYNGRVACGLDKTEAKTTRTNHNAAKFVNHMSEDALLRHTALLVTTMEARQHQEELERKRQDDVLERERNAWSRQCNNAWPRPTYTPHARTVRRSQARTRHAQVGSTIPAASR